MPGGARLALPLAVTLGAPLLGFVLMGVMPMLVFGFAFGGGLLLYLATLWRWPIDTRDLLVPYLATVSLFILHVWEEYLTDFEDVAATLSGRPVPEENFLAVAAFIMPMSLAFGAIAILKRWSFGDYFLCAFFFAMIFAELAHFTFPFLIEGRLYYVSGMYTAALPLIPALWGLRLMLLAVTEARASARGT